MNALRDFHNRLRILFNIDRDELENAGVIEAGDVAAWNTFATDPIKFFLRCNDSTTQKLWTLIEARHNRRNAS